MGSIWAYVLGRWTVLSHFKMPRPDGVLFSLAPPFFFSLLQTNQYPHSLAFHRKDYREMAIKGLASITSSISKPLKDSGSCGLGSGTWCPVTLQGLWESLRITLTSEMRFVLCTTNFTPGIELWWDRKDNKEDRQKWTRARKKGNIKKLSFIVIEVFYWVTRHYWFQCGCPLLQNGFLLYQALGDCVTGMSSRSSGLSNQGIKIATTISANMKGRPLQLLAFKRKHPRWWKQTGTLCI